MVTSETQKHVNSVDHDSMQVSLCEAPAQLPPYGVDLFQNPIFDLRLPDNEVGIEKRRAAVEAHGAVLEKLRSDLHENTQRSCAARLAFLQHSAAQESISSLFAADALSPAQYALTLDSVTEVEHTVENDHPTNDKNKAPSTNLLEGTRMHYSQKVEDQRTRHLELLAAHRVYGQAFDGQHCIHLSWPECMEFRDRIDQFLQSAPFSVVLPFAYEPDTAHIAANYAGDLLGYENVIPVSANVDSRAEKNVGFLMHSKGQRLQYQNTLLDCINWKDMERYCGIKPSISETGEIHAPKGSKGLTMFAGILAAYGRGQLFDRYVAFHDTDIQNVHGYDALRHLAVPLLLEEYPEELSAILIAKTGAGRNNQSWTNGFNLLASNAAYSAPCRQIARVSAAYVWALSGERAYRGDDLYRLPLASRMEIETQLNVAIAAKSVAECNGQIAQVVNPTTKVECGFVGEVREWDMLQHCGGWGLKVLNFCNENGLMPHTFSIDAIREFNQRYGGKEIDSSHQSPVDGANSVTTTATSYMLPSMQQMIEELNVVDLDRLHVVLGMKS